MNKADFKAYTNKNFWALARDKTDNDTANLYIYSDVQADEYDWWNGKEIKSETSSQHFREELEKLGEVNQINIYINSKGGDVYEGLGIYSQLKRHKAKKTAFIDGYACSIASVIAMACDEVIMSPPAVMMIHSAWSFAVGNAKQLRKAADDLDKITESVKQAYLYRSNSKISVQKLTELMDAETWLTSGECLKYGFADSISGDEAEPNKPDESKTPDKKEENNDNFTEKAMSVIGNFFM